MIEAKDLVVGHIYRARNPRRNGHYFNDRQVLYKSDFSVQYDGPAVPDGVHYPLIPLEKFLEWAGSDVTEGYPKDDWQVFK